MDDTFSSNFCFVYSPHLYIDVSIMFSGLSGELGSAGCVLKIWWQFLVRQCCRKSFSLLKIFSQMLYLTFPSMSYFSFMIINLYSYAALLLYQTTSDRSISYTASIYSIVQSVKNTSEIFENHFFYSC